MVTLTEERANLARSRLSPEQIRFAEWLAMPLDERNPSTQRDLALVLDVSEITLSHWKKIGEIRDIMDDIISARGKELVPLAIKKLKGLLNSDNSKVQLDAAKDILSRWGDVARQGHIVASIKDLYNKYRDKD